MHTTTAKKILANFALIIVLFSTQGSSLDNDQEIISKEIQPRCGHLSSTGPWLLVEKDEQSKTNSFAVMNADGTCKQPLNLPDLPKDRHWTFLKENNNSYLVFRDVPNNYSDVNIRLDKFDPYVWIIKLPENRIIKKIPLINEEGWGKIDLNVLLSTDSFIWSPDGRYITYTAALDASGTDLFIYDVETDSSIKLTSLRQGAQAWFWKPDGTAIIYRDILNFDLRQSWDGKSEVRGVYRVTLKDRKDKQLYIPRQYCPEMVGRITEDNFLAVSAHCVEYPLRYLREISYSNGDSRAVYNDAFIDFAVNLSGKTTYFWVDRTLFDFPEGLFLLDNETGSTLKISDVGGNVCFNRNLNLFVVYKVFIKKNIFQGQGIYLYDENGKEKIKIADASSITPSPDGKWIVANLSEKSALYDSSGDRQMNFDLSYGLPKWTSDSSGFWSGNHRLNSLIYYDGQKNWKSSVVYEGPFIEFLVINKNLPPEIPKIPGYTGIGTCNKE